MPVPSITSPLTLLRSCALRIVAASVLLASAVAHADDLPLITAEESLREQNNLATAVPVMRGRALTAPRIDVLSPDLSQAQSPPLSIRLRFDTDSPASVDPASLKVYYGVFRVDITERLLKQAKLQRDGLELINAQIPGGTHRLLVEVRDTSGRTGQKLLTLVVKEN